jgi:hypothetical protein
MDKLTSPIRVRRQNRVRRFFDHRLSNLERNEQVGKRGRRCVISQVKYLGSGIVSYVLVRKDSARRIAIPIFFEIISMSDPLRPQIRIVHSPVNLVRDWPQDVLRWTGNVDAEWLRVVVLVEDVFAFVENLRARLLFVMVDLHFESSETRSRIGMAELGTSAGHGIPDATQAL